MLRILNCEYLESHTVLSQKLTQWHIQTKYHNFPLKFSLSKPNTLCASNSQENASNSRDFSTKNFVSVLKTAVLEFQTM